MRDVWLFAMAVATTWVFWIGLLLTVEPYLESAFPKIGDFLKRTWTRHPDHRKKLFRRVGVVVLLIAFYQTWSEQHSARNAAEANIASLTDQLAKKKQSDAVQNHLQAFYAEGEKFTSWGNELKDDIKFEAAMNQWRDKVSDWISKNMGVGASERFLDVSQYLNVPYFHYQTSSEQMNWYLNYATFLRRNLLAMQSDACWDRQS